MESNEAEQSIESVIKATLVYECDPFFSFLKKNVLMMKRWCLIYVFKQQFSVFKQHYTYLYTLFHPHVFSHIFSNNNFLFLSACTKHPLMV